jgi:hypothetical protein
MFKYLLQPVVFDGIVYFAIAVFGYLNTSFGSDEAAKYISPLALFWLRESCGAIAAGALALKMYRSTTFAEYRQAKNGSYHTGDATISTKQDEKTSTINPPTGT